MAGPDSFVTRLWYVCQLSQQMKLCPIPMKQVIFSDHTIRVPQVVLFRCHRRLCWCQRNIPRRKARTRAGFAWNLAGKLGEGKEDEENIQSTHSCPLDLRPKT